MMRRTSPDVTYLSGDPALELDGVRRGPAGWWLRGGGDATNHATVASVFVATPRSRVIGYDLVMAAPRPVSILLALGSELEQRQVIAAHRECVRGAISYLEDRALVARDYSQSSPRDVAGTWQSIVSFTHGVNRHGEPHLHDHVLVGAQHDNSAYAVDARSLGAHLDAADALYRSSLRLQIREATGRRLWHSFRGLEHVEGIDDGYRSLWPGHHDDRGEKLHWTRRDARQQWQRDLRAYQPEVEHQPPPRSTKVLDEHVLGSSFEGRRDVSRRELVRAFANAATFGARSGDINSLVSGLYPELATSRGIRESVIGLARARAVSLVRVHGPRPSRLDDLAAWYQRDRSRGSRELQSQRSRSDDGDSLGRERSSGRERSPDWSR